MIFLKHVDLGIRDYKETWDYQQQLHSRLMEAKAALQNKAETQVSPDAPAITKAQTIPENAVQNTENQLIFVEHPHVYTLGKSGRENNLLVSPEYLRSLGASFYKIDRGGDITYHGPGQLVGYPVIDLDAFGMGVKQYVHTLEQTIMELLRLYSIKAGTIDGATGVWLDAGDPILARKICAIGVRVSRGITMHGFALNVNTDLAYFSHINPCGFSSSAVTSLQRELGREMAMQEVKDTLLEQFRQLFGVEMI